MRKDFILTMIQLHNNATRLSEAFHLAALVHSSVDIVEKKRNADILIEIVESHEKMKEALSHLNNAIVKSISFYEQQTGIKFSFE